VIIILQFYLRQTIKLSSEYDIREQQQIVALYCTFRFSFLFQIECAPLQLKLVRCLQ